MFCERLHRLHHATTYLLVLASASELASCKYSDLRPPCAHSSINGHVDILDLKVLIDAHPRALAAETALLKCQVEKRNPVTILNRIYGKNRVRDMWEEWGERPCLLDPAEGCDLVRDDTSIDADHAILERLGDSPGAREAIRVKVCGKPIRCLIRRLDDFLLGGGEGGGG